MKKKNFEINRPPPFNNIKGYPKFKEKPFTSLTINLYRSRINYLKDEIERKFFKLSKNQ